MTNKKEILDDIKNILSKSKDTKMKTYLQNGKYSETVIRKRFPDKNWAQLIEPMGFIPAVRHKVTYDQLIKDVKKVIETTGSTKQTNYIKHGLYSRSTIKRLSTNWNTLLKNLGYEINMYKPYMYNKKDIIDDYKRVKREIGKSPSAFEYRKLGKFSQTIIDKVFGSYTSLKKELNEIIDARFLSNEELEENLLTIYKKYGTLTADLIDHESIVSAPTIYARYGTIKNLHDHLNIPYVLEKHMSKFAYQCLQVLEKALGNDYVLEYTFPWLKNSITGRNYRIDCFYPALKLAIEFDGEQHFIFKPSYHKDKKGFEYQIRKDKEKDDLLEKHNIKIIRIRNSTYKNIFKILQDNNIANMTSLV